MPRPLNNRGCLLTQVRGLTVNQLLRGGRAGPGIKKGKSRTAKFQGAPFKKGICVRVGERALARPAVFGARQSCDASAARAAAKQVYTTAPKKPNSANRKVAKVKLSNGLSVVAYIPGSPQVVEHTSADSGGRRSRLAMARTWRCGHLSTRAQARGTTSRSTRWCWCAAGAPRTCPASSTRWSAAGEERWPVVIIMDFVHSCTCTTPHHLCPARAITAAAPCPGTTAPASRTASAPGPSTGPRSRSSSRWRTGCCCCCSPPLAVPSTWT